MGPTLVGDDVVGPDIDVRVRLLSVVTVVAEDLLVVGKPTALLPVVERVEQVHVVG